MAKMPFKPIKNHSDSHKAYKNINLHHSNNNHIYFLKKHYLKDHSNQKSHNHKLN